MQRIREKVEAQDAGARLDQFLAGRTELTRSRVLQLIEQGCVRVDGAASGKAGLKLRAGQEVEMEVPSAKPAQVEAQDIPLSILYQDADIAVVDKPCGMVVHPAAGNEDGTLVNALLYHLDGLSGIGGEMRPGIVHRLDKDTSGLLIVAKNDMAHQGLAEQIQAHSFTREYRAIVYGNVKEDQGTVDQPIGRHPVERKKMAVLPQSPAARRAVTHYVVEERLKGFTYLRLRLETGRTHQIRVHMAYLGHPVAGDPVYGPKKVLTFLQGQCLHAGKIGFVHPRTGEYLEFTAPLPAYFSDFLEKLRREG